MYNCVAVCTQVITSGLSLRTFRPSFVRNRNLVTAGATRIPHGTLEGTEAGALAEAEGAPPVPEGVPSTAARVAMEMRAEVKGRMAA